VNVRASPEVWTARGLFPQVVDPDRLSTAFDLAARGKRRRPDVAWALFRREALLRDTRRSLVQGRWWPKGFEMITIRDPKPRVIARAPFMDRVVHCALTEAMLPALLRPLTEDVFASRPGYGTHRAVLRLLRLMRSFRFVLHLDIRTYFPSINLEILESLLRHRIRDPRFIEVLDRVLDAGKGLYDPAWVRSFTGLGSDWPIAGRGLPIGASTSQALAAHLYLCELDHRVKRHWRVPGYVRFCDDLFLFTDEHSQLVCARTELGRWLSDERELLLKRPKAPIRSTRQPLRALGYRISRGEASPRGPCWRRMRRRLRRDATRASLCGLQRSVASSLGMVWFGVSSGVEARGTLVPG